MTNLHAADALDDLADFIEHNEDGLPTENLFLCNGHRVDRHVLSMDVWLESHWDNDSCETAGCIAGTKWLLDSSRREPLRHSRYDGHNSANAYTANALQLDDHEAAILFRHKDPPSVDLSAITPAQVITALRRAAHGKRHAGTFTAAIWEAKA